MPSKRSKHTTHTHTTHTEETNNTYGAGFMLAIVGYGILAFLPLTPARLWWWLLAVLAIPALTGATAAKGTSKTASTTDRFSSGFWTCILPMFAYVSIRLMVAHYRVGSSGHALSVLFVGAIVACVYALAAGIVAGIAGLVFYLRTRQQGGQA